MFKKFFRSLLACSLLIGISAVMCSSKCYSYGIDEDIDPSYRTIVSKFSQTQLIELKSRTIKQAMWQVKMSRWAKECGETEDGMRICVEKFIDFGPHSFDADWRSGVNKEFSDIIKSSYTETLLDIQSAASKQYQSINIVPSTAYTPINFTSQQISNSLETIRNFNPNYTLEEHLAFLNRISGLKTIQEKEKK